MHTEFVALWDDDILPGRDWLRHTVEYSRAHNDALVGVNGRTFSNIVTTAVRCENILTVREIRSDEAAFKIGFQGQRVDYVGHSWTLRRHHLAFFLGDQQLTLETGEDMQLAYSLQKRGIFAHQPPLFGQAVADTMEESWASDEVSEVVQVKQKNDVLEIMICFPY